MISTPYVSSEHIPCHWITSYDDELKSMLKDI